MAKQRSPNYPALGLGKAIELARALYEKERRSAVLEDVAVTAWGYSGMSGNARTKLSALRKYGLLEDLRDGSVRLTDRALNLILHDSFTDEFIGAAREAAMAPDLFRELYVSQRHASEDAIERFVIIKKAFSPPGAKQFAQAFRETLEVAKLLGEGSEIELPFPATEDYMASTSSPTAPRTAGSPVGPGQVTFSWPLSRDVTAQLTVKGYPLEKAHLSRLRQYVDLAIEALEGEEAVEKEGRSLPADN